MIKFKQIVSFVYSNRRVIGTIIGGFLALLGYTEEGSTVQRMAEQ